MWTIMAAWELQVARGRGWVVAGAPHAAGTQKSSPRLPPTALPAALTTKCLANLALCGAWVGDDFCVPPQHEEPTQAPHDAHAKPTNEKTARRRFLWKAVSDQLRLGIKVPASANTEFGAVIFNASTLGRANTPLRTEVTLAGAGSTATPLARCSATS